MKSLRRIKQLAPRTLRRRDFDLTDATREPEADPPPEAVFDRATGPWGGRGSEET